MIKTISGYCPTQQKNYTVDISYLDASDLSGRQYIKSTAVCEYIKYGNECTMIKQCPLYSKAPEVIN